MLGAGLLASFAYTVSVAGGYDFFGRSARDLVLRRRLRLFDRRFRKLRRIEKKRVRRLEDDASIRARGSRMGFRTQVDEFGPWMRDSDLRMLIRMAGWTAADHAADCYRKLRERGVELPPWPDPETGKPPGVESVPEQDPKDEPVRSRKWRQLVGRWLAETDAK